VGGHRRGDRFVDGKPTSLPRQSKTQGSPHPLPSLSPHTPHHTTNTPPSPTAPPQGIIPTLTPVARGAGPGGGAAGGRPRGRGRRTAPPGGRAAAPPVPAPCSAAAEGGGDGPPPLSSSAGLSYRIPRNRAHPEGRANPAYGGWPAARNENGGGCVAPVAPHGPGRPSRTVFSDHNFKNYKIGGKG